MPTKNYVNVENIYSFRDTVVYINIVVGVLFDWLLERIMHADSHIILGGSELSPKSGVFLVFTPIFGKMQMLSLVWYVSIFILNIEWNHVLPKFRVKNFRHLLCVHSLPRYESRLLI